MRLVWLVGRAVLAQRQALLVLVLLGLAAAALQVVKTILPHLVVLEAVEMGVFIRVLAQLLEPQILAAAAAAAVPPQERLEVLE